MKPIAILHNDSIPSADYFLEWLDHHHVPYRIIFPCDGDAVPRTMLDFSGLVVTGGSHSVQESLPCITFQRELICKALQMDKPVMGIGFGALLTALAMGALVLRCAKPCIGWHSTCATGWPDARRWLGNWQETELLYWHYENFTIPPTAKRILFGQHCLNTGFVQGKHIALQCNLNHTETSYRQWLSHYSDDIRRFTDERPDAWLNNITTRLHGLHHVADIVYGRWLRGFNRPLLALRSGA